MSHCAIIAVSTRFAVDGRKLLEMDRGNVIACAVLRDRSREGSASCLKNVVQDKAEDI